MSRQTILLIILLFLLTVVLLMVASPKKSSVPLQEIQRVPTTSVAPSQVVLSLSPNPLVISSQSATIDVTIDTGVSNATAVQLELLYDPKMVTSIDVSPASFFANPMTLIKNIDRKNGRVSFAFGISPTGSPRKGTGTVATVTVKTSLRPGQQTTLSFSPKTIVTAAGSSTSVLKSSVGTTIIYPQITP